MWKGFSSVKDTPSTIARSEIDMFHTQMAWSFLRLTLQNYLKLQCFPVHISYFLAKLHIFGGYRSREKGNFTRRIVKILPHIFPPKSDDCNTSNRLNARFFSYNQNLLTSQERTMVITQAESLGLVFSFPFFFRVQSQIALWSLQRMRRLCITCNLVPRAHVTLVLRNGKTKTSGKMRLSSAFHWPLTERAQFHRKLINNDFVPRFSISKPRAGNVHALGTIASSTNMAYKTVFASTYKSTTRS